MVEEQGVYNKSKRKNGYGKNLEAYTKRKKEKKQ